VAGHDASSISAGACEKSWECWRGGPGAGCDVRCTQRPSGVKPLTSLQICWWRALGVAPGSSAWLEPRAVTGWRKRARRSQVATLKTAYATSWQQWETILKVKVKLSTGRASELMQIADGRKDLQQIRDGKAQSVARLRARTSSLHPGCSEEEEAEFPDTISDQEGPQSVATALDRARSAPGPPTSDGKADVSHLIDALAGSDAKTRGAAAEALINGARQTQFASVSNAVADLYQRLSSAGR